MSERYEVPVISKAAITPSVTEVTLDISKTNFRFAAGQYATIAIIGSPDPSATSQYHDFSIVSSPSDHQSLKIAFRNSASFFKTTLLGLPLGGLVILEGPSGVFTLPEDTSKPIVCIADGIGITPFMSMFATIGETKQPYDITLFYSNRDSVSTAYASDLQQLTERNPSLKAVYTMTNDLQWKGEAKAIEGDFVASHVGDLGGHVFYIAGPPTMVSAVRDDLRQAGVADADIHTESFTGIEIEQVLTGSDYDALISSLDQTALVSMTDAEGHIIYVNQKFVEMSKYPLDELLGQNHRLLKSGDQPDQVFIDLWATISSGRVWRGEIKNKAKDGTFYWVDTSIAPILGQNNAPERYISVRFLITDKKERELELQNTKAMCDAILSTIAYGLVGADRSGRIVLVNTEAERMLGLVAHEATGQLIDDVLVMRDGQNNGMLEQNRPFQQVLSTREKVSTLPGYSLVDKNGARLALGVTAAPILMDGAVTGVIEVFHETNPKV